MLNRLHKTLLIVFFIISFTGNLFAQVIMSMPARPKVTDTIDIVFNAAEGNGQLKGLKEKIYFHAGLIVASSNDDTDWKYVVGEWGTHDKKVEMIPMGSDLYRTTIPIIDFFGITSDTEVFRIGLVFRNEDGTKVGKTADEKDIFIDFEGYIPRKEEIALPVDKEKKYLNHQVVNDILIVSTDEGDITFRPFSDSILEITMHRDGFQQFDSSHAVIMMPQKIESHLTETPNALMFDIVGMQVHITKTPFKINFLEEGKSFLKEEIGFYKTPKSVGIRFETPDDEMFYGSGGRASGLNLRGKKLGLYNRANYGYGIGAVDLNYMIPLVVSSKDYMLFFDNPQKGYIDIDNQINNVLDFSTIGGTMRYFVIVGENKRSILSQYSQLTGYQPLLPIWAYGNLMSRMAYRTQDETDSIANLMLKEDFPVDAVIIDFYWFGDSIKGHLGRLDWYKPSWQNPDKMIADFKEKGIKTILISEPYIIDTMSNHQVASKLGLFVKDSAGNDYIDKYFYFGNGSLIDIFKPEAAEWLWQQYKKQFDQGIAGLWGDLGEPESHPSDIVHCIGKADEVHNIYGHYWTKTVYERFRRDFPNRRLFFLARSGAAGTQRYGIVPWTGDVGRSWEGFQAQIPAMLNMSLSGVPYMHSDAGGFALGVKDEELYTRWLQYSTFTPVLRPHGSDIPSEPVYFNDTTKQIVRYFMHLRYQLLPYIYTTAWENSISGKPITSPIFFYNNDDKRFKEDFSGYYFGKDMLIYPIVNPDVKATTVELPKGIWYNFWTGTRLNGGAPQKITVGLEKIPVFVRAGSILPMTDYVSSTDYYNTRRLFLHTFLPDGDGKISGKVYCDDGQSFDCYNKGEYQLLIANGEITGSAIDLSIEAEGNGFAGMPEQRMVEYVIYGRYSKISRVSVENKKLSPLKESKDPNKVGFWQDDQDHWHIRFRYSGENTHITIQ